MALGRAEMQAVILDLQDRIEALEENLREMPSRWGANEPPGTPFRLLAATGRIGGSFQAASGAGYPVAYDEDEQLFLPLEAASFEELSGHVINYSTVFANDFVAGGDVVIVFQAVEGSGSPDRWFLISSGRKYISAAQQPGTMRNSSGSGFPLVRIWPMGLSDETIDDQDINNDNIRKTYLNDVPTGEVSSESEIMSVFAPWGQADLWTDDTITDRAERLSNPLEAGIRGYLYSPWANIFHAAFAPCGDGEEPPTFDNQSRTTPLPTQPGT